MPSLSNEWIQRLGPAVFPFERKQFRNQIAQGEDIIFTDDIHMVSNSKKFKTITTPVATVLADRPIQSKYLWIIDEQGLKLILESTPNEYADRGIVCHTNITGGAKALQGGELWFGDDKKVYINYKSGRYGAGIGKQAAPHKVAILEFFRSLNFDPIALDSGF